MSRSPSYITERRGSAAEEGDPTDVIRTHGWEGMVSFLSSSVGPDDIRGTIPSVPHTSAPEYRESHRDSCRQIEMEVK